MNDDSKCASPHEPDDTIETTSAFRPKFGLDGLIPAIVTDAESGNVLMFAHMNADALAKTVASGIAHFWSRSRGKLWKKGEESGNLLNVREIRTDCDQDVIWLIADVAGNGVACHTGETSCFYRRLTPNPVAPNGTLLERAPLPDPNRDG